jgi:preprotein translocase subunit SecF
MRLDVIKNARLYLTISTAVIVAGIVAMLISFQQLGSPLRLGLEFTGGTQLSLGLACEASEKCGQLIDIGVIRRNVESKGFTNTVIQEQSEKNLHGIIVKVSKLTTTQRQTLVAAIEEVLQGHGDKIDPKKSQIQEVDGVIGQQALQGGLLAILLSFAVIGVYLAFRFQLDYATFAVLALFHDIFVTVGAFSILGLTLGVEIDSLFIVAMLTICGFSVNDTVVIYDRIRENVKLDGGNSNFKDLVNASVNQTLGRSINTSLTATLPLVAIFLFGGATLRFFALALIIGFLSGAYSSIFNASILLAWWRSRKTPSLSQPPLEAS